MRCFSVIFWCLLEHITWLVESRRQVDDWAPLFTSCVTCAKDFTSQSFHVWNSDSIPYFHWRSWRSHQSMNICSTPNTSLLLMNGWLWARERLSSAWKSRAEQNSSCKLLVSQGVPGLWEEGGVGIGEWEQRDLKGKVSRLWLFELLTVPRVSH